MALVETQQRAQVHVGQAVAVSKQERVPVDVLLYPLDASAGHRVLPGIGEGHGEVLLLVLAVVADLGFASEADGKIVAHCLVLQKIVLDRIPAISETQHEFTEPIVRIQLHDVPQNGPATDLDHRLRPELGFLSQTGALPATENDHFHRENPAAGQPWRHIPIVYQFSEIRPFRSPPVRFLSRLPSGSIDRHAGIPLRELGSLRQIEDRRKAQDVFAVAHVHFIEQTDFVNVPDLVEEIRLQGA